jgi:hypothetical protein
MPIAFSFAAPPLPSHKIIIMLKGLTFWRFIGLLILISAVGGVIYRLAYGKQIIDAQKEIIKEAV